MTRHEQDRADAIDALYHRLKELPEDGDKRALAAEFVQALIGQGWRRTEARPAPKPTGPAAPPPPEFREQLAVLRAHAEQSQRERQGWSARKPGAS